MSTELFLEGYTYGNENTITKNVPLAHMDFIPGCVDPGGVFADKQFERFEWVLQYSLLTEEPWWQRDVSQYSFLVDPIIYQFKRGFTKTISWVPIVFQFVNFLLSNHS